MEADEEALSVIDRQVNQLFALVSEALAKATDALLSGDLEAGQAVVDSDATIDQLTAEVDELVWAEIDSGEPHGSDLRHLVGLLLLLPELERSADLAEHIAQRAVTNLGPEMTPRSRGIVQLMSEVALEMWRDAADAYAERSAQGVALDEADDELDLLRDRLTKEVDDEEMPAAVACR
jgi:phosphate transport system protein